MRLHLYLEKNQKGIFLICGDQFQFNTSFQKQLSKPAGTKGKTYINPKVKTTVTPSVTAQGSGFYTEWFSFDRNTPKKIIDIKNPKFGYKSIYKIFLNDYKKPFKKETGNTLRLPDKITTNLVFLSEDTKGTFQPTKIGIWEIIKTN